MIRSELTSGNSQKLVKANIASILPCNEMQQAFYVLSQQSEKDPGVILAQADLQGRLDRELFERSWDQEILRHEALRMSVRPKKDQTPMLVVWKELEQEIEFLNGPLDDTSRHELITQMKSDIGLETPPVSKVVVEPVAHDLHRIYWAFHHLFMDGWSTSVVLRDVVSRYCALAAGDSNFLPAHKPTHSEYVRTFQEHDFWAAREHWSGELKGYSGCRSLPRVKAVDQTKKASSDSRTLSKAVSAELHSLSRDLGLTSGTIAAGIWSLVVHKLLDCQDISLGMTVAGRNVPIEGIHNFVGLLSGVIPFRSKLDLSQDATDWLLAIRKSQFRSQQFEYLPMSEIEELCELQPGLSFCDTLLVVENFLHSRNETADSLLNVSNFSSGATSGYPITCFIIPGDEWKVRVDVDASVCVQSGIEKQLANSVVELLIALTKNAKTGSVEQLVSQTDFFSIAGFDGVEPNSPQVAKVTYTETELRLASIWEKVMGLAQVLPADNFFEVGGKSVTAVRICAAIEKQMGVKIPPSALIESPTIAELAKKISTSKETFSPILRFNERQSDDLIVCCHVGAGYASYYRHLARHLSDFQVVGVQSTGLNDGKPAKSFEALASTLADGIQRVSDAKRVHLIGYCMSAKFIVALARELEQRDRSIGSLISIDSGTDWNTVPLTLSDFIDRTDSVLRGTVRYVRRCGERLTKWIRYRTALVSGDTEYLEDYRNELVGRETARAFNRYDLGCLEFPFKLIRSRSYTERRDKDFHMNWREYSDNFEYCIVDTSHEQILLEPDVRKIGDVVREIVESGIYSANSTIWRN